MSDIFISYSKADHALALKLSAFLEAEGWSVWWDKSLAAADLYRDEIMTIRSLRKLLGCNKVPNMMCLTSYVLALVLVACVKVRKAK